MSATHLTLPTASVE